MKLEEYLLDIQRETQNILHDVELCIDFYNQEIVNYRNLIERQNAKEDYYKKNIEELKESIKIKSDALNQADFWSEFKRIYGSVSVLNYDEQNKIIIEGYKKNVEFLHKEIINLNNMIQEREIVLKKRDDEIKELKDKLSRQFLGMNTVVSINGKCYLEVGY